MKRSQNRDFTIPNPSSLKPEVSLPRRHAGGRFLTPEFPLSTGSRGPTALLSILTLSSLLTVASCSASGGGGGGSFNQAMQTAEMAKAPPPAVPRPQGSITSASSGQVQEAPRSQPQLIKKANLTLVVQSIEESSQTVTAIVRKQSGDIIAFQDRKPPDTSMRHVASLEIRVPQERLDETLNELAKLGTVQDRSMMAEDVTNQIVDNEARLRNLRKSEEMVLKIMDRSGSVGDVLKASQELTKIRESIERLDAQLKSLRSQVAYSSITLNLEAAVSAKQSPEPSLALRIQESWGKATHSVGEFTLGLMAVTIWLLAYSPYLLILAAGVYGLNRLRRKPSLPPATEEKSPTANS